MASSSSSISFLFLLFSFLFYPSTGQTSDLTHPPLLLLITKDSATSQYFTQIHHGTPLQPVNLVVDLAGPFLWFDCGTGHVSSSSSSSQRRISSCSPQCSRSNPHRDLRTSFPESTRCDLRLQNGVAGELVEDTIATVDYGSELGIITKTISTVENFLFVCTPSLLLHGLPSGTSGVLGLGKAHISLPSQTTTRKFTMCLSSTNGVVSLSDGFTPSTFGSDISRTLKYTPLIKFTTSTEYYITVRSIEINGKKLSLKKSLLTVNENGDGNGKVNGGTKLSTMIQYTTLENSIYNTMIKAYLQASMAMNLTRVTGVAPFELCFQAKQEVPIIDLVLQSQMVKWRIHGRNSMVRVGEDGGVMCLGVLDGGLNPVSSIVIGGFQLEDNVLEFDLGRSMLGFGSLMGMKQRSCSGFLRKDRIRMVV